MSLPIKTCHTSLLLKIAKAEASRPQTSTTPPSKSPFRIRSLLNSRNTSSSIKSSTATLLVDLSSFFSSSNPVPPTLKSSQDPSLGDIDLGLGPSTVAEYEDNNGSEEGDREENEVCDSGDDSSQGSDFDESGEDVDEEVKGLIKAMESISKNVGEEFVQCTYTETSLLIIQQEFLFLIYVSYLLCSFCKRKVVNFVLDFMYTFPPESKCPNNTTNFVESFNGEIKLRY
ncbi:hypothetical protein Cgig2_002684 [Carnegiea gigantea]|uniref:Uncharacterized protein n=1 Tax=Carnegiea gigantea TaxID=171969 RepID=A0A9Q1JNM6_9CARY|nr:hypothetical protein Cgig2_002684 [Carnegiea gigantea]